MTFCWNMPVDLTLVAELRELLFHGRAEPQALTHKSPLRDRPAPAESALQAGTDLFLSETNRWNAVVMTTFFAGQSRGGFSQVSP